MTMHSKLRTTTALGTAIGAIVLSSLAHADTTLSAWALMPAKTFAPGPTSGQFATSAFPATNPLPLINAQPVQGFSAVLSGPSSTSFYVMPDNGFGAKTNSADALLRMYAVTPNFRHFDGSAVIGAGTVDAADYQSGVLQPEFNSASFITLRDPDHKLGFTLVADQTNYPNGAGTIAVDQSIRDGRLLTGADFDIEAVRQDKHGNLWFGDEFGPFLVKTDASGKVLRSEIALPGVQSPQNPFLVGTPNLGRSNGFEGVAINAAGDKLITLLEGTVSGDPAKSLRINEFDIESEAYTAVSFLYQLESAGTNIGDMTAINDHQYLVIERNGATATGGGVPFKKIYLADTAGVANGGFVHKTELVDLMNIADPHDLNGDGATVFTFPFVTIEDVLLLDANTLLVINDNNYPGGGGRGAFADNTEFLKLTLAQPVPVPTSAVLMLSSLVALVSLKRRK